MRIIIVAAVALFLTACSADPGSEQWCKAKEEESKSQWTGEDAKVFAQHCIFASTTKGSKEWCEKLEDKPKGDWTASEAGDYAKNCVM